MSETVARCVSCGEQSVIVCDFMCLSCIKHELKAKLQNEWHFPSKGEFPDPDRMVECGYTTGERNLRYIIGASHASLYLYCWRYIGPLPPVPQAELVKASEDGVEEAFEKSGLTSTSASAHRDNKLKFKAGWDAAQAALKEHRE